MAATRVMWCDRDARPSAHCATAGYTVAMDVGAALADPVRAPGPALVLLLVPLACAPFGRGDRVDLPPGPVPVDHGVVVDEDLADLVDAAALRFLADAQTPALAVALVRPGEVLLSAGYGWAEIETERAMEAHTPVLLSSVSKTFIGVAAMQAVEDGVVDLDEPISDLVGFAVDNPRVDGETLTLRHALTHTSGIEDTRAYDRSYAPGDPTIGLRDFVRGYVTRGGEHWRRRNFAKRMPGAEFSYSNVGAALGALAVGEARGLEFMDLLDQDVLEPLGMEDSAYLLADLPRDPAVPYDPTLTGDAFRPWPQYGYPTYPDGLMRASVDDMARYLAAIAGGGRLGDAVILEPASVDAMLTVDPDAGTDEDGQAIIWSRRRSGDRTLLGHDGGDYGSTTELWLDREAGVGVVLLTNAELGDDDGDALIALVLTLLELAP